MANTQTTSKPADKQTASKNGTTAKPSAATAPTQPAPVSEPAKGKRGRKALETMTPAERKAWDETQVLMKDLVCYNDPGDGKPNLEASRKAFDKAFALYIVHRPTKASAPSASNIEVFPPEMLAKIEKIAADAFNKRAKVVTEGMPKEVATEPFLTFIFQALGIDPFEADEKRKSILRALTNSLGYERVKVQLTKDTETHKAGEFVLATGKNAALFRPSK